MSTTKAKKLRNFEKKSQEGNSVRIKFKKFKNQTWKYMICFHKFNFNNLQFSLILTNSAHTREQSERRIETMTFILHTWIATA